MGGVGQCSQAVAAEHGQQMGRGLTVSRQTGAADQEPPTPVVRERMLEAGVDPRLGSGGIEDARLQREMDRVQDKGVRRIEVGSLIAKLAAQQPAPARVRVRDPDGTRQAGLPVRGAKPHPEPDHGWRLGAR